MRPASSSGRDEVLLVDDSVKHPLAVSRDGRHVLYEQGSTDGYSLRSISLQDRTPVIVATRARRGTFSPEVRRVAYESNVSERYEIFVQPFPGPGERIQVSTAGGVQVRWRADGRELFYVGLDRQMMAVPIQTSPDGHAATVGAPTALFRTRIPDLFGFTERTQFVVSPDAQRLLVSIAARLSRHQRHHAHARRHLHDKARPYPCGGYSTRGSLLRHGGLSCGQPSRLPRSSATTSRSARSGAAWRTRRRPWPSPAGSLTTTRCRGCSSGSTADR